MTVDWTMMIKQFLVIFISIGVIEALSISFKSVEDCVSQLNKIKTLSDYVEFDYNARTLGDYDNEDLNLMSSCFKTNEPVKLLTKFYTLIESSRDGQVCSVGMLYGIIKVDELVRYGYKDENTRLYPIFEQFVKKVILTCKRSVLDKIAEAEKYDSVVYDLNKIGQVARNVRWDNLAPIGTVAAPNGIKTPFGTVADNFKTTSGSIENIVLINQLHADTMNNIEHSDIDLNSEHIGKIYELRNSCNNLQSFQRHIFYTIIYAAELGYTVEDDQLDRTFKETAKFHQWLLTTQFCEALRFLKVLIISPDDSIDKIQRIRLMMTIEARIEHTLAFDETNNYVVIENNSKLDLYNFEAGSRDKLDDSDFMDPARPVPSHMMKIFSTKTPLKKVSSRRTQLKEKFDNTIKSENFLKAITNYIQQEISSN